MNCAFKNLLNTIAQDFTFIVVQPKHLPTSSSPTPLWVLLNPQVLQRVYLEPLQPQVFSNLLATLQSNPQLTTLTKVRNIIPTLMSQNLRTIFQFHSKEQILIISEVQRIDHSLTRITITILVQRVKDKEIYIKYILIDFLRSIVLRCFALCYLCSADH